MKFNDQLKIGQIYELLTIDLLNITEYETTQDKGVFKKYDVFGNYEEKLSKLEVKTDGQVIKYSNLFIEFSTGFGKDEVPSGISTSEADYLVYYARKFNKKVNNKEIFDELNPPRFYRYYVIPMKVLNNFIKKHRHTLEVKRGGDNYKSSGYIIPEKHFHKYLHLE
jgi:hypothetical protein